LLKPNIGKNVKLGSNVHLGKNIEIGANTIIENNAVLYDGVRLGANSFVGPNCVLGERLRSYHSNPKRYIAPVCKIGAHAILRTGTVIHGGATIGSHFETGPYVTIREKTVIGNHSRFGNYSDLQGYCKIGNHVSGHSNVTVGQYSTVSDYVWLHPYSILINDWYPPTGLDMKGPIIGAYSVIGAGSMIYPGVKLGKHVIVAAQSGVRSDVKDFQIVSGLPAKETIDSRKLIAMIKGKPVRPYPWMQHRKV
jgi:acetyltransferase-like isoleucine patch superfamily enzyme